MIFLTVNKNFLLCGLIVLLILFSILDYICVYCFIKELKNYMFIKKLSKRKIEIVDAYDNEIIKLKKEILMEMMCIKKLLMKWNHIKLYIAS